MIYVFHSWYFRTSSRASYGNFAGVGISVSAYMENRPPFGRVGVARGPVCALERNRLSVYADAMLDLALYRSSVVRNMYNISVEERNTSCWEALS